MTKKAIYIVCHSSGSGRSVLTATTSADRAAAYAAEYAGSFTTEGWRIDGKQSIPAEAQIEPPRDGIPAPVEVYHLTHEEKGWLNVELYRVTEDQTTKNERR